MSLHISPPSGSGLAVGVENPARAAVHAAAATHQQRDELPKNPRIRRPHRAPHGGGTGTPIRRRAVRDISAGACGRGVFGSLLVWLAATPALATASSIRFDTIDLVSCRDVTAAEFAMAAPRERLVEGRFRVSALVAHDPEPEETQYVYQFLSPGGLMRVVDYGPKTQRTSDLAGNLTVEEKKEQSRSLGLSLTGDFQRFVHGTADSGMASKTTSSIRYELKPPQDVVLLSGTVERGTGVYFHLLPSRDRGAEGTREFVIVMRVPGAWRGDVLYVRCEAQRNRHGQPLPLAVARFVVGLYAESDDEARTAAEEYVWAEASLRRTVARNQRVIEKRSVPSLVHKVGTWLDVYDPRIPNMWLDQLVYGSTSAEEHDFYGYLPGDVRRAVDQYSLAKRRIYALNGGPRLAAGTPWPGHADSLSHE